MHLLPSELSHSLALLGLRVITFLGFKLEANSSSEYNLLSIKFKNRLGLAAGMDKNGDFIDALASLGFGFLEIGTVTPYPQKGNPKPRLFRLGSDKGLVNGMGFNNKGVDHLIKNLNNRKSKIPLGISIGKNFDTPNENAYQDYLFCLRGIYKYADYVAINISSPNTKNLRMLQLEGPLNVLLAILKEEQQKLSKTHGYKPLFIKISPDNTEGDLQSLFGAILKHGIDGLICTNTTAEHNYHGGLGGLSGAPLFKKSSEILSLARSSLGKNFPIIASGGVMTKDDYNKKIEAGASLVQIYTGFIFSGPSLINDILNKQ